MLTTNMIRKDLSSQNQYDAGVTLSGLACFINQDLARDLANDLMTLVFACFVLISESRCLSTTFCIAVIFNKTLHKEKGSSAYVQSFPFVSRCSAACISSS